MPRPCPESTPLPCSLSQDSTRSSTASRRTDTSFIPRTRIWRDASPGRRRPSCLWCFPILLIVASLQLALSTSNHIADTLASHGIPTQTDTLGRTRSTATSFLQLVSPSRRRLKGSSPDKGGTPKNRFAHIPCPQNVTAWGSPLYRGGSELPKFKWTPAPGKTLILFCDQGQVRPPSRPICLAHLIQRIESYAHYAPRSAPLHLIPCRKSCHHVWSTTSTRW